MSPRATAAQLPACQAEWEGNGQREALALHPAPGRSTFAPFFWFGLVLLFRAAPVAYGRSQARGLIRATAARLRHGHNNAGSKLHLQPTPQLMATPDPEPTEQGQRLNPHPHGYYSDSFPLCHNRNSNCTLIKTNKLLKKKVLSRM